MVRNSFAVLLVASTVLAGCGSNKLMPTPVAFDGRADPLEEVPATRRDPSTRIFIVTDRTPSGHTDDPGRFYTGDRDYGLRVGVATVDIGRDMSWEELHAQSLLERREREPLVALTGYEEFGPVWTEIPHLDAPSVENPEVVTRFAAELNEALDASNRREIYIFVHGFNTTFAGNTEVAAEMYHYLGRQGVFISYEWPSQGSLFAYEEDKAAATYSVRYFRLLIAWLAGATNARVNVLAHSAGAPVAVSGIAELCLMHHDEGAAAVNRKYRIGHVVLVAPDMDLQEFENRIADELVGVPERLTVYASTRDKALGFSKMIWGFARLGSALTELRPDNLEFLEKHPNFELVDVAAAERKHGSWLGHSYFHEDPWVSSDVIMSLRFGGDATPEKRGLEQVEGRPVWGFPKDYPERAREAARLLYGGAPAEP